MNETTVNKRNLFYLFIVYEDDQGVKSMLLLFSFNNTYIYSFEKRLIMHSCRLSVCKKKNPHDEDTPNAIQALLQQINLLKRWSFFNFIKGKRLPYDTLLT